MKKLAYSIIVAISIGLFSCTEIDSNDSQIITGSWLLYEQGYSPGAGYIVKSVSDSPPQVIVLNEDSTLTSTIEGWTDYKYYQVLKDTIGGNSRLILALFKLDPGSKPKKLEELDHSYNISFENGDLRLAYRFCMEGCHLAFREIKQGQD
jgi:hypothetical protein